VTHCQFNYDDGDDDAHNDDGGDGNGDGAAMLLRIPCGSFLLPMGFFRFSAVCLSGCYSFLFSLYF
jgi:hypothetical protein